MLQLLPLFYITIMIIPKQLSVKIGYSKNQETKHILCSLKV